MPRGIYDRTQTKMKGKPAGTVPVAPPTVVPGELGNVDLMFDEIKATLEQKKVDYEVALARINDLLHTLAPKPRMGRPPKTA